VLSNACAVMILYLASSLCTPSSRYARYLPSLSLILGDVRGGPPGDPQSFVGGGRRIAWIAQPRSKIGRAKASFGAISPRSVDWVPMLSSGERKDFDANAAFERSNAKTSIVGCALSHWCGLCVQVGPPSRTIFINCCTFHISRVAVLLLLAYALPLYPARSI
jgi:hypothetical protein